MGLAVYPGARPGGGGWGGWGGPNPDVEGNLTFGLTAGYREVVRFYQEQCRRYNPTIRQTNGLLGAQTLLVWQDDRAGYAVLVEAQSPLLPLVRQSAALPIRLGLSRVRLGPPRAPAASPAETAEHGIAPEELKLPVYPHASVAYSGWAPGERGRVAVARLETPASGSAVAGFYRGLARQHRTRSNGCSQSGFQTVSFTTEWDADGGRIAVAMLHPAWRLPTVVWLRWCTEELASQERRRGTGGPPAMPAGPPAWRPFPVAHLP